MNKYSIVVLARMKEDFLERLQQIGMVDVTLTSWEPSEEERALLTRIEKYDEAAEYLRAVAGAGATGATAEAGAGAGATDKGEKKPKPFLSGEEAFEKYSAARREITAAEAGIAHYEKLAEEVRPLGDYDPEKLRELAGHGVPIEFLFEQAGLTKEGGQATIAPFIPDESPARIEANIAKLKTELRERQNIMARAAATLPALEAETESLKDRLQFSRTAQSGEQAADGSLVVMEAWARERQAPEVERLLEEYPGVLYVKSRPTPEDETPVELHNTPVSRPFEFIAEMYALPRYGTMDLTRWFAPFYMLFFAFCLSDAGYGLLIFLGGLFLVLKSTGAMKAIGKLSMWCGGAAAVFGFFAGSMFGIDIREWGVFEGRGFFFPTDRMFLFAMSLGLGVFQILFGMVLKVITTSRAFGLKYALATIGWIIVILTGIAMIVPGMMKIELGIPRTVFYVTGGIGLFMMLFLNNPGKNPLVNFGGGLWNTYNDITGFLSDALSYIRLFAIGLSGGVLATVFNDLAFGLTADMPPVVAQLLALVILLIGHGLNLFMSTLSSMVHPLRLTFVEFYKNAGFEASARTFNPLKRTRSNKQ